MNKPRFLSGLSMLIPVLTTFMFSPKPLPGIDRSPVAAIPDSRGSLTIDGTPDERIWRSALSLVPLPSETGVPLKTAGKVMLITRGGFLCIAAFCPEAGGEVLARSIGRNPVWEKDAVTSSAVEDRIVFELQPAKDAKAITIAINPWGACRIERDAQIVPSTRSLAAATISDEGWYAEYAVPLSELIAGSMQESLGFRATRIRSRRPLDPEFIWHFPSYKVFNRYRIDKAALLENRAPDYEPSLLDNSDSPLIVGYIPKVPPPEAIPDDPFWLEKEGFILNRNDRLAGTPEFGTEVKWVHDGTDLALHFRCEEDTRLDCDIGTRDGNIAGDDHVCIYLSTTGSSFIEIQINPVGIVRDALGQGPHMYRTSSSAWNGNIRTDFHIDQDAWYIRANIPLDDIAGALGENHIPFQWRVLVGRNRQPRKGEVGELSTLPVIGNPYLLAPARYRKMQLSHLPPKKYLPAQKTEKTTVSYKLAESLSALDSDVFSRLERKVLDLPQMLDSYLTGRIRECALDEISQWKQVETLEDWKEFRQRRVDALKRSLGAFPAIKPQLNYQVSSTFEGDGFQVKNIAFQSRPGFYVAANLYLPENLQDSMPGIVIIPSHHYPKIQGELKDSGIVWARSGCAVLILDSPGYGERVEVVPWYRQPYQSESQLELQLNLVGQNRLGWIAWDVMRSVDVLLEMGNIDPERLVLIGSVTWGGGRPASIAGLLDERIDVVIPFNWGRVYWDSYGVRRSAVDQISPWVTCASIAPRKFVYAHEFSWEGEEGNPLPEIFSPAWSRFNQVYSLYGAEDNLRYSQGKGLLRVPASMGDCYSLGSVQRRPLYYILNDWLDIPLPSVNDMQIEMDSWLTFGGFRTDLDVVRYKESRRRMQDAALLSISPQTDARIERIALHELALAMADQQLAEARKSRLNLDMVARREVLAESLAGVLGNIEPAEEIAPDCKWSKELAGASFEAFAINPEPGIMIPVILIKPVVNNLSGCPVVIGLAEEGKRGFLQRKGTEMARLIESGIAVCLPDLRGNGETAPSQYNRTSSLMDRAMDIGETMLGMRLRDVRTVLKVLSRRDDLDGRRIAVWGESFSQINTRPIWVDELTRWPISPQIEYLASPQGAHLALLTALFEPEIRAVAVNGGLSGYRSLLESNITYVPFDIVIPEIFSHGDIADICAALAPMPLYVSGCVDGKNRTVDEAKLRTIIAPVKEAYRKAGRGDELEGLSMTNPEEDLVSWLCKKLAAPE